MGIDVSNLKGVPFFQHLKLLWIVYYPFYVILRSRNITMLSPEETIEKVVEERKSLARYGDGEFNIMLQHKGIRFQEYDSQLAAELELPFKENLDNLIVAVPHGFVSTKQDRLEIKAFWWHYIFKSGRFFSEFIENLTGSKKRYWGTQV
ncbi:GT-D fold domain-containing glycosyltransferase [Weissella confusa]|uniref:GT-D fold domain-containing glycosyltransferase n=1 Tax=Weissella confusa TaxID=1583 RepID=UPI00223AC8A4|nr:GT-D fold domain-containing glycosyltransferase [Weissella confusa]MCT0013512.1 DUF1792 domain-containing protein [Weissella confusa]